MEASDETDEATDDDGTPLDEAIDEIDDEASDDD